MKDFTIPTHNICPRSISFSLEDGKIYNINGMEVKSVGRNGIYIIDGKKVIQRNN